MFITPVDDGGIVVGITAGATKVSLTLPAAGVPALARQLLELLPAARKLNAEEIERIRELVTTDEYRARLRADAMARRSGRGRSSIWRWPAT
jgi:hypothetical protein